MNQASVLSMIYALGAGAISFAFLVGIGFGVHSLVKLKNANNGRHRESVSWVEIGLLALACSLLVYLQPTLDSILTTVFGTGDDGSSPLSWSTGTSSSGGTEEMFALMIGRFFQLIGVTYIISGIISLPKLKSQTASQGDVTLWGIVIKFGAGALLLRPVETAAFGGEFITLLGSFSSWMSSNGV